MWVDLYTVVAVLVAAATWLLSPHLQSYDPPGDIARGVWSAIAGALWPVVVVGVAQVYAVRYVAQRIRPVHAVAPDVAPLVAMRS
ncbi:hypothetical protein FHT40_000984 [Mycolicibacterium sp. BK556]|uniref:hypothetical protein n=1 Tax=unclassified Mycolicibacterium TaxID=2636767 RepID=UPI00161AC706|nr:MULTISPECIES: hypothetical protein [unclassified Mycolicibacterium]MBB3601351.1 hypothetical protein [Mycolicibacterium sp. BK556]MBB3631103.1 hypothetical protein [Mycolicibacterium sp. BK607]